MSITVLNLSLAGFTFAHLSIFNIKVKVEVKFSYQGWNKVNMFPFFLSSFDDFCASFIQDWWRDSKSNRPMSQHEVHKQQVQQMKKTPSKSRTPVAPEPVVPKRPPRPPPTMQEAATVIQRSWRRHIVSICVLLFSQIELIKR